VRPEILGKLKKIHLIETRTRDIPACSTVAQPTTLPLAPIHRGYLHLCAWIRTHATWAKLKTQLLWPSNSNCIPTIKCPVFRISHEIVEQYL
jgi:hypothetical protein